MRRFASALAVVGMAILPAAVRAASGPGSTGGVGLKVAASARPESLGGAFVGLADDPSALFWNPAGLANVRWPEVSLMHASYLADTNYDVLAYAQPLGPLGTVAGSINMLSYGNLPHTLEQANGLYGGVFGNSSPQDLFLTGGWGTDLPPIFGMQRVRAGASLKLTVQELTGGSLVGVGVSGGALWDTPVAGLRLGTVIDNLGALAGEGRMLPFGWAIGSSYGTAISPDFSALYAVDARVAVDTTMQVGMGLELTAFDLLMLRAGWQGGGALGGPTLGVGVKYPLTLFLQTILFKFDYAMASSGELGNTNRFQLSGQIGGWNGAVRLGSISLTRPGGEPMLTWKGKGPAYRILVRPQGTAEAEFVQLTDRPVTANAYSLAGLPAGRYIFRIETVDPYQPGWKGPISSDLEVELRAAPAPATPPAAVSPAPASSSTGEIGSSAAASAAVPATGSTPPAGVAPAAEPVTGSSSSSTTTAPEPAPGGITPAPATPAEPGLKGAGGR